MLSRVLEPEVMDADEDARDYDAMDHSHVNRAFVADFRNAYAGEGPILDVGVGTAQIPIELCRQFPRIHVVGIDASLSMIDLARAKIDRAGFASRIEVRLVDAKDLPFADGHFAAVMSNSIVHHIPDPGGVLAEMARVSSRAVFVRDLLRPECDAAVAGLVALYAANDNAHQRKLFDDSLRAALSLDEIQRLIESLGFDPKDVRQTSDRHWTWIRTSQAPG